MFILKLYRKFYILNINNKFSIIDLYDYSISLIRTKSAILLVDDDIEAVLDACQEKIERVIDEFIRNGSGWNFVQFTNICVHAVEYRLVS